MCLFVCFQETETTHGEETKRQRPNKKHVSNGNAIMLWENCKSDKGKHVNPYSDISSFCAVNVL